MNERDTPKPEFDELKDYQKGNYPFEPETEEPGEPEEQNDD